MMELRKLLDPRNGAWVNQALCDAEHLITNLRAENERLREALRAVVITGGKITKYDYGYKTYDPIAIAKESLK